MKLGQLGNLVINRTTNQYSLNIRSKQLTKLKKTPQDLLKARIDFLGIKK